MSRLRRDLLAFYTELHQRYGDVVYMRLGPVHDYTLFHPDAIKELLITKAKNFIRFPWPLRVLRQWNGDGLLITEGETWLRATGQNFVETVSKPDFDGLTSCQNMGKIG